MGTLCGRRAWSAAGAGLHGAGCRREGGAAGRDLRGGAASGTELQPGGRSRSLGAELQGGARSRRPGTAAGRQGLKSAYVRSGH